MGADITGFGIDNNWHYYHKSSVGSLLGGFRWADNGNGTFTVDCSPSKTKNGAYHASPLDLYLMGLIDGTVVPPIYVAELLQPPYCDKVVTPDLITSTVTITDIQNRVGVRSPGPATAQRAFNLGFVAESHQRMLSLTELTFYEILAAHFTKTLPSSEPDPYVGFDWVPITRFFGQGVTWSSDVPQPSTSPAFIPITSFSPTRGPTGTFVFMRGTNLTGTHSITFNGVKATVFQNTGDTHAFTVVPEGATTGPICVTTTSGGRGCSADVFTFVAPPPPIITSISPNSGRTRTFTHIQGTNLRGFTSITFNGVNATTYLRLGDTGVVALVPNGATTGPVCITASSGTACAGFTVILPPPTITSINPNSGRTRTFTHIQGTNLRGFTSITFNGVNATTYQRLGDGVSVSVPVGATTGPVCITTSGGQGCSAGVFTVLQ